MQGMKPDPIPTLAYATPTELPAGVVTRDDDNTGTNGDAILYFYDAGIDGTLSFNPGNTLASASFNPPNNSWTREQVTFDASSPAGLAVEGNRIGIAMFLSPTWQEGTAADAIELTGPIATPPAPPSPLERQLQSQVEDITAMLGLKK